MGMATDLYHDPCISSYCTETAKYHDPTRKFAKLAKTSKLRGKFSRTLRDPTLGRRDIHSGQEFLGGRLHTERPGVVHFREALQALRDALHRRHGEEPPESASPHLLRRRAQRRRGLFTLVRYQGTNQGYALWRPSPTCLTRKGKELCLVCLMYF